MAVNRPSKRAAKAYVSGARSSAEHRTIVLVPAASSCSAFNYYANDDAEREAASARFRAAVTAPPARKMKKK